MFFKRKEYKISLSEWDELKPEEALHDAGSGYNKMELPINRAVFNVLFFFIFAGAVFYLITIFKLQAIHGNEYLAAIENVNSLKYFSVPVRGVIYDSNDKPLVENVPNFSLLAITGELNRQKPEALEQSVAVLSSIINIPVDEINAQYQAKKNKASFFYVKNDLSKEELIKIKDAKLAGFYGIYDASRHYLDGPATAHLLGYTARVDAEDMEKDFYYQMTDRIGRYGLEAQYEKILRGSRDNIMLNSSSQSPEDLKSGQNLHTSIDADVQRNLYEAMITNGVGRGAAVAQDPRTGAILGIVSLPSFDGNIFESGQNDKIAKIFNNSLQPLFNRAISGKYSPGSTIKPLLAMAGLKEGVVTPQTVINATGSITVPSVYDPSVAYTFHDWKVHGLTDIKKAIAWSVDVYFYALAGGYGNIKGLGAEKTTGYYKTMLADLPTGIDLPGETTGFVPTPDWKKKTKNEPWFIGDTYNISIGQGDLGVTPIWINSYISSIANRGKIMKPYIVSKITDSSGKVLQEMVPQTVKDIPFDQSTIQVVREGMRQTITDGTAGLLNDLPVPVAAKTGTAQVVGLHNLNSLFTVFGPYEDPTITLTILVENIQGGQGAAIRVANTFLKWYFSQPR